MGAIQLIVGILRMTPDLIGKLSQFYLSYSTKTLDNLSAQKADAITGILLVSIAFIMQLLKELFDFARINLTCAYFYSILLVIGFCLTIFIVFRFVNRSLRKHSRINAGKSLLKWHVKEQWFKDQNLLKDQIDKIEGSASILLFFERLKDETNVDYLRRLGNFANIDIIQRIQEKYKIDLQHLNELT